MLIGLAFATFEKLPPDEQELVKHLAICTEEAQLEALNTADLVEWLGVPAHKLREQCVHIINAGIFRVTDLTRRLVVPRKESDESTGTDSSASLVMRQTRSMSVRQSRRRSYVPEEVFDSQDIEAVMFSSRLHQYVARTLVLKSEADRIRRSMPQEADSPVDSAAEDPPAGGSSRRDERRYS